MAEDWTASVSLPDPAVKQFIGNRHDGETITPYQRDNTSGEWSSIPGGDPADEKLNKTFEWLCAQALDAGVNELHGRWGDDGPEVTMPG